MEKTGQFGSCPDSSGILSFLITCCLVSSFTLFFDHINKMSHPTINQKKKHWLGQSCSAGLPVYLPLV
jgi:hypothetical protein